MGISATIRQDKPHIFHYENSTHMPTSDELYEAAEKLKDSGKYDEAIASLVDLLSKDELDTLAAVLDRVLENLNRDTTCSPAAERPMP
jgi:hypothetical protein